MGKEFLSTVGDYLIVALVLVVLYYAYVAWTKRSKSQEGANYE